ncbi:MAG TPA: hypothetical protein VMM78_10735 [Thermomicrobiales bacterium]|nr:hypothetical protein [Thermomicrobiales bacterium]
MHDEEPVEVQVQRIREAVLARHGLRPGDRVPARPSSAVNDAQQLATINAHWGIGSDAPVVGGALVLFRRMLRIVLRWYINPIVDQQNRFNQAAVRALFELRGDNEKLRVELNMLDEASEQRRP